MLKIIDKNHMRSRPKSWWIDHDGKRHKINFYATEHFDTFYTRVASYTRDNNIPVPTYDELEHFICLQIPGECTEGEKIVTRQVRERSTTGGCKACGRRR